MSDVARFFCHLSARERRGRPHISLLPSWSCQRRHDGLVVLLREHRRALRNGLPPLVNVPALLSQGRELRRPLGSGYSKCYATCLFLV